jgi:hypothetical protein
MPKHSLLLITFICLLGCSSPKTETTQVTAPRIEPAQAIGQLNDYLKKYETPPQTFSVSSSKLSQIKGKQGTLIQVNPGDYEMGSGKLMGKNIQVELIELTNQQHLLANQAQTVSNGRLLVSGGAYYINMTSEGEQLKLRKGKKLPVQFARLSEKEMSLFYGQRDSMGQMNWQPAQQKLQKETITLGDIKYIPKGKGRDSVVITIKKSNGSETILTYLESDTTQTPMGRSDGESDGEKARINHISNADTDKVEAVARNMYEVVELNDFGWINCDRFYEISEEDKTDLRIAFPAIDSIEYAVAYLVFKDLNSVMDLPCYPPVGNQYSPKFLNIPLKAKTKLIAFTIKKGKSYLFQKELTIKPQQSVEVNFKEATEAQLAEAFSVKK